MSSKRAQRRKSCEGKRPFSTAKEARSVASGLARAKRERPLHAYCCDFCGAWHLGHPPKRVRISIAARRRNAA